MNELRQQARCGRNRSLQYSINARCARPSNEPPAATLQGAVALVGTAGMSISYCEKIKQMALY
jgi:hypothetical protein